MLVLRRWAQGTQAGVGRQLSANGVHVLGYGARVASYAAGCRLVRLVWGLGSPLQGQAGRREVSEMRRTAGSVTVSIRAPPVTLQLGGGGQRRGWRCGGGFAVVTCPRETVRVPLSDGATAEPPRLPGRPRAAIRALRCGMRHG